jgi:hypothetical protein
MPSWAWVVVLVGTLALAVGMGVAARQRRRWSLRRRCGPEYERTVAVSESRHEAESELQHRRRRHHQLDIRPLTPASTARYTSRWGAIQERFVDAPADSVLQADSLIVQVMWERGYPMEEFEQRVADISVDHPTVVRGYQSAHAVAVGVGTVPVETEDLRRAMVHYHRVFDELLEPDGAGKRRAR